VDLVPPPGEIFRPALGMDAAAVSDEEEDHSVAPPGSSTRDCDNTCPLRGFLGFFMICR
jgi:hypothetical protein